MFPSHDRNGELKCLTWVHDGTTVFAYENGILATSATKAMNIANTKLILGQRYDIGDGMPAFINHTTVWNEALNATAVNESYQCFLNDEDKSTNCGVPLANNFTVTAKSAYNQTTIQTFNVTIGNTIYQTTDGEIVTTINGYEQTDITFNTTNFEQTTISAYNAYNGTTLQINTTQPIPNFTTTWTQPTYTQVAYDYKTNSRTKI